MILILSLIFVLMFSLKRLIFIAVLFVITINGFAQINPYAEQINPNEYQEVKPVLLRQEMSFGLHLHTSGFGIEFKRGRNITGYRKVIFEAQLVSMKHPKEVKQINPYFENSKSYIYGKLNTFNIIRAGVGQRNTLYSKADRTGVEVRFIYLAGLSLGITKPVYLEILSEEPPNSGRFDIVTERYDPEKHFIDNIYGRAPFTYGLDEINFHPGGFAKIGFNFEYAPFHEDIKSIEVGAVFDAYPKKIPIMATKENKQFFLSFFITFIYGRKW